MSAQDTQQKEHKPRKKTDSSHVVVPSQLPPAAVRIFKLALRPESLEKGFTHILKETSDQKDPLEMAGVFLSRYEEQILRLQAEALADHAAAFRAALILKCLEMLPFFRVRFAEKGYNILFLKTWFQKRLLATLLGISERDVDAKIRHSGQTPPRYLDAQLVHLIPQTCLEQVLK